VTLADATPPRPPEPRGRPRAEAAHVAFDAHHPPERVLLDDCVHCGFCLTTCPTYVLWGEEMDTPRGRILLMDLGEKGELGLSPETVRHWDSCLGCMACVTSCPSGVRYDRLIEATRQQVERRFERPASERATRDALFALLRAPRRLTALGAPRVASRAAGLQRRVRASRLHGLLPGRLRHAEALAPTLTVRSVAARVPRRTEPAGATRLKVALLLGCVQRAFFADVNATTAAVLAAYGCEVLAPRDQGCCGALEVHAGREASALARARRLIAALEASGADRIAVNSAGCGSTIKEYGHLLADDPEWAPRAAAVAAKARDVSEILAELGPPPGALQPLPMRLAYHDACHLAHAQGVREEPRAALREIPGVELVEIPESAVCCGSAGVYNLVEPEPAAQLGLRKAANVRAVEPDALAAANPGCLIQIGAHLRAGGGRVVPTFHPVELLAASLAGEEALDVLARRRRLLASAGAAAARA